MKKEDSSKFINKKKHFLKSVIWIGSIFLLYISVESLFSINKNMTFLTAFKTNVIRYEILIVLVAIVVPAVLTFYREKIFNLINRLKLKK